MKANQIEVVMVKFCFQTVKALVRCCECAGLSEPSLFVYVISNEYRPTGKKLSL